MRALLLLALIPLVMWLGQTIMLLIAGRRPQWRISSDDLPRRFKRINRVLTNGVFVLVLLGYPLLRGLSPLTYYTSFLPCDIRVCDSLYGAAAATLYLTLLYLAWTLTDNVRLEIRHSPARLLQRWAGVPFTAILVAFVEELLFRAMLLADLLQTCPAWLALAIGVLIFAGAHYVRRVKRYWTFPGHLALGLLFCMAFYLTGTLWLSLGLHAGGVLVLMVLRPCVRYRGPAWLVGASIFPYAGIVGVLALLLLTLNLYLTYGGAS